MTETKTLRGFARLARTDPAALRKICAKGGRAAHVAGTAHQWTSDEAVIAGRKGGRVSRRGPASTPSPQG